MNLQLIYPTNCLQWDILPHLEENLKFIALMSSSFKLESKHHGFLKYLNQVSKLLRKKGPVSEGQAYSWCSGKTTLGVWWSEAGAAWLRPPCRCPALVLKLGCWGEDVPSLHFPQRAYGAKTGPRARKKGFCVGNKAASWGMSCWQPWWEHRMWEFTLTMLWMKWYEVFLAYRNVLQIVLQNSHPSPHLRNKH